MFPQFRMLNLRKKKNALGISCEAFKTGNPVTFHPYPLTPFPPKVSRSGGLAKKTSGVLGGREWKGKGRIGSGL